MSDMKPLADVRIVDLTMGWSGPLATRQLADMGAEVIKIEACSYPDWWRGWEYSVEAIARRDHERAAGFNQINRNKYGVAIDLTCAEGRDLALRLIARADAVIENQAATVMPKLGLGYADLQAVNPQIIMLSLPAFGITGPWSSYRGYGSTVEHAAGLPHMSGEPTGPPIQNHIAYGDACGGLNAAAALLVALYHLKRTGEGQRIDLSQVECMLQMGIHASVAQGLTGEPPVRTGNRHPVYAPHGCFPCSEPDTWLVVAVTDDQQWPALCRILEHPQWLADQALAHASGRHARADEIEAVLGAWTQAHEAESAMAILQTAGIPAGAVQRASDLVRDPCLQERQFWPEVDREYVNSKPHPATPWLYDGYRGPVMFPAPCLGEHNDYVFCDLLGMAREELDLLREAGVIGDTPIANS